MKFETAHFSCCGTRDNNEDCAAFSYKKWRFGVWAIADGLGGHANGEIAAQTAVEEAVAAFAQNPNIDKENVGDIMNCANRAVWLKQDEQHGYDSMKTTLAAVFMRKGYATVAHAGDSRVYIFRKNRVVFQTRDHTLCQIQMENGSLPEADVRFSENRNQLLCALGAYSDLSCEVTPAPVKLRKGDTILLCTDGFWERVLEQHMEDTLSICKNPGRWLELMRMHIERQAAPKQDNYTAMAVFIR